MAIAAPSARELKERAREQRRQLGVNRIGQPLATIAQEIREVEIIELDHLKRPKRDRKSSRKWRRQSPQNFFKSRR